MKEVDDPTAVLTVSKIMNSYAYSIDMKDVDGVLDVLADDVSLDYGDFGVHEGKEEVREYFTSFFSGEAGILDTLHLMLNPQVEVDGDTATGTWNLLGLNEVEEIGAAWLAGYYNVEFSKEGDEWFISNLVYDAVYFSPYDEGWVETPMAN